MTGGIHGAPQSTADILKNKMKQSEDVKTLTHKVNAKTPIDAYSWHDANWVVTCILKISTRGRNLREAIFKGPPKNYLEKNRIVKILEKNVFIITITK